MKKKRFVLNFVTSFGCQIVNLLCGFILPQLILAAYGTEINGLVSSITQFLTVVSLTEFGMTAVVQSSLYGALAGNDENEISKILTSSSRFFGKIGRILVVYVVALSAIYPVLVHTNFDFGFVSTLVIILSINSIAQYFLGITNDQLLSADQHAYITSATSMTTTILNTVGCYVVIRFGFGVHAVKLTTALIFLIRPIVSTIYVRRHYRINWHIKYETEPIKQKWNGVSQHIAYYVFSSTDVIVLTLFSTLENVSIYSVYTLILNGLKQLCSLFENGIKPLLGESWAKHDLEALKRYFSLYELLMHLGSIFVFGTASSLIVEFVSIYTSNVTDANYIVPGFAMMITIAYAALNIRNPYNTLIQAVGYYKQTQFNYIIAAIINIIVSICMVYRFGLIGVAVGTLIAASYQDIWQAVYMYKNVLDFPRTRLIKLILCDAICFIMGKLVTGLLVFNITSYVDWVLAAVPVALTWMVIILFCVFLVFREEMREFLAIIRRK